MGTSTDARRSFQRQNLTMIRTTLLRSLAIFVLCAIAGSAVAEDPSENLGTVIGIDLGTTYSCVGVYVNGKLEIIANDQGNRITPSYVAFTDTERLIGDAAKNQATNNPTRTVFDAKRLIGRKYSDKEVQRDVKMFPFKVVEKDSKPCIEVELKEGKKVFQAEEISAMILVKMKETAEAYLGRDIRTPSSPCPRTSTTRSARRPRTPAPSPA